MKQFRLDMDQTLTAAATSNIQTVAATSIPAPEESLRSTSVSKASATDSESPPSNIDTSESSVNNTAASSVVVQLKQQSTQGSVQSNAGEQKRPMNAFLMFCKRHRSLVKEKNPQLENRGVTKILGDLWSKLDKSQKSSYTELARQHKEAFMKANPDFKWYKTDPKTLPTNNNNININNYQINNRHNEVLPPGQTHNFNSVTNNNLQNSKETIANNLGSKSIVITPNSDIKSYSIKNDSVGLSAHSKTSTDTDSIQNAYSSKPVGAPKPPKKRYLENGHHNQSSPDKWNMSNQTSSSECTDSIAHLKTDRVVPFHIDQDTLEKVIEHCYSEASDGNSSGTPEGSNQNNGQLPTIPSYIDPIKCYNSSIQPMNLKPTLSSYTDVGGYPLINLITTVSSASLPNFLVNKVPSSRPHPPITTLSSSYSTKVESADEPVDFSMNRTIITNRQNIIDNLVEKMLSEPIDDGTSTRSNGLDNTQPSHMPPPQYQALGVIQSMVNAKIDFYQSIEKSPNNQPVPSTSSVPSNLIQVDNTRNPLQEFNLEKKLTELPLLELNATKFATINNERQLDGLATLAEAAFLSQNSETSREQKTSNAMTTNSSDTIQLGKNGGPTAASESSDVSMEPIEQARI